MILTTILLATLASAPRCTRTTGDAAAILQRAATVTGFSRAAGRVLRFEATDVTEHDFESDRTYPPYIFQASRLTEWFDPANGADRTTTRESMIGGYQFAGTTTLGGRTASYAVRDTALVPSVAVHAQLAPIRPLDAWAVLADWLATNDARVDARCDLRDYPRIVLARPGAHGPERLYLDPKSGYPVAFERTEPHYLWGQQLVRYVYATWTRVADVHVPGAVTRMVDGHPEMTRSFGQMQLVPRDSAPSLALPRAAEAMPITPPAFLAPTAPDTVRVSASTFLLRNRGYAEAVTLANDTVFVLDATQGDARARQDSAWIGKLFPGRHAIAVVVTDLAWPHIAGVRYWVAQGALIISHATSRAFLDSVVSRRWTDAPDLLEQRRSAATKMHFRPVKDSLRLGGGAITVFPIDGVASEGAVAAYVHRDAFLWASDYVQNLEQPTQYLDEVAAAVRRMGYSPAKVAAQHLPLVNWSRAVALAEQPLP